MHRIMGSLNCSQPIAVIQPPAKTTLRSKYIRNMTGQVGLILQESVVYCGVPSTYLPDYMASYLSTP